MNDEKFQQNKIDFYKHWDSCLQVVVNYAEWLWHKNIARYNDSVLDNYLHCIFWKYNSYIANKLNMKNIVGGILDSKLWDINLCLSFCSLCFQTISSFNSIYNIIVLVRCLHQYYFTSLLAFYVLKTSE